MPMRQLEEDEAIGCVPVGRDACPKADLGFTAQQAGRSDIPVGKYSAIPSARQLRRGRFEEGPRFLRQARVQNGPENSGCETMTVFAGVILYSRHQTQGQVVREVPGHDRSQGRPNAMPPQAGGPGWTFKVQYPRDCGYTCSGNPKTGETQKQRDRGPTVPGG